MKEILATIAALLAIAGNVPYVIDIFRKRVQPHAYTWFVWTIVSGIVLFGQLAKGPDRRMPTASELFTIFIFLLSLRYGFPHATKTDLAFLLIALCGLIPWAITDDPTLSVVIAVAIDITAFVPTLRKTWLEPVTETPTLYALNVARHVLALFSLQAYNIATTLHSIAMIIANSWMTFMIVVLPRIRRHGR